MLQNLLILTCILSGNFHSVVFFLLELNIIIMIHSAAAFIPSLKAPLNKKTIRMGYEDELGVLPPVGFFDPLGKYTVILHWFLNCIPLIFRVIEECDPRTLYPLAYG